MKRPTVNSEKSFEYHVEEAAYLEGLGVRTV